MAARWPARRIVRDVRSADGGEHPVGEVGRRQALVEWREPSGAPLVR